MVHSSQNNHRTFLALLLKATAMWTKAETDQWVRRHVSEV